MILPPVFDGVEAADIGDEKPETAGRMHPWPFGDGFEIARLTFVNTTGQTVAAAVCCDHQRILKSRSIIGRCSMAAMVIHVFNGGFNGMVAQGFL